MQKKKEPPGYIVVAEEEMDVFLKKVNNHLKKGYLPVGGISQQSIVSKCTSRVECGVSGGYKKKVEFEERPHFVQAMILS